MMYFRFYKLDSNIDFVSDCFGPIFTAIFNSDCWTFVYKPEKDSWKLICSLRVYSSETYTKRLCTWWADQRVQGQPRTLAGLCSVTHDIQLSWWLDVEMSPWWSQRRSKVKGVLLLCWQILDFASDLGCNQTHRIFAEDTLLKGQIEATLTHGTKGSAVSDQENFFSCLRNCRNKEHWR